jgi:hypothetical protein
MVQQINQHLSNLGLLEKRKDLNPVFQPVLKSHTAINHLNSPLELSNFLLTNIAKYSPKIPMPPALGNINPAQQIALQISPLEVEGTYCSFNLGSKSKQLH